MYLKNIIKNNIFTFSSLLILAGTNLFLTTLPLFNILSYESSVINAVLFSIISGIYILKFHDGNKYKAHFYFLIIAIFIPLVILFVSTILCQKCPLDDGIYFYILVPLPSIIIGITIACYAEKLNYRFRYLLFILLWLFVLLGFLPELYYNPQIYLYNPIFGYFPGVIYDQGIAITGTLVFYRICNLIFASLVIYLVRNIKYYKIIIPLLYLLIFIVPVKSFLGFETNLMKTKSELNNEVTTEHFNIIFPDTLTKTESDILIYEHEFYYHEISNLLNTEVDGRITSIIYGSREQKKELFGSANADVAKPWLNQIYITLDNYENSLKHEISHIFSANYASGPFKIPSNLNPGMIEGFAMAVENNYDDFDIDYLAALAYNNDYKISLTSLFSGLSFFSNASSISYIYAGSFLKYLANNYGWGKVKDVYVGGIFKSIFGKELSDLENEYNLYIKKIEILSNNESANYYFGRTPLIKRNCARATSKNLSIAAELVEDSNYVDAATKFIEVYKYSKTYGALIGYVYSKKESGEIDSAIDILSLELPKYKGSSSYYYLEFLLADYYSLVNDSLNASKYYHKIIDQNPHLRYYRSAFVKNNILSKGDSLLIKYMNEEDAKIETIKDQVRYEANDYNVQLLTRIKDRKNEDYLERIELILNANKKYSFSSDTYFNISKLAYDNLDLEIAIKYAEESFKNSDYKREAIITEHLNKLNWIKTSYNN